MALAKKPLPIWVQHQVQRRTEAIIKQQSKLGAVELTPAFGVSVPACWSDWLMLAPCSGCSSPKTCQGKGKCRSAELDRMLLKGRKAPAAWAKEKTKFVNHEAKGSLGEACARHRPADAEHRWGALVYAATALRETIASKDGFKVWFPGYDLRWSAYPSGILKDQQKRWWWLGRGFRFNLSTDRPHPRQLHFRGDVGETFLRYVFGEKIERQPDHPSLWAHLCETGQQYEEILIQSLGSGQSAMSGGGYEGDLVHEGEAAATRDPSGAEGDGLLPPWGNIGGEGCFRGDAR